MGCDIHLFVEIRKRQTSNSKHNKWFPVSFRGEFSDRIYGMFSALANVRNYNELKHLPIRGLPEDLGYKAFDKYYSRIIPKNAQREPYEWEFSRECVRRWVLQGISTLKKENGVLLCSDPDAHTPNWCTTAEMRECFNQIFLATGELIGDYIEWLGLCCYMEGIESSGEYECRAVFWFDN